MFCGNYNYVREGANQALNRLVKHLEERVGAEVRVYSPITATPAFEPEGTLVPIPSVTLPFRTEFQLALGLPKSIREEVKAFEPHIVHVSTPDILNSRALTFARELGAPVVASLHTSFETYPAYYGFGFLRPMVERHLDRFYGRSDHVLVPTPAIAQEMARKLGAKRVSIWGRGVDADLFSPSRRSLEWRAAMGIAEHEIAVLFFGRLVLEKGIDSYVTTVRALSERGLPVRPVLVGEGPARPRIEQSLPDAILTGHLAGDQLAIAVASSDTLLHPSVTETFGNVLLEAMASGLPIVAARHSSSENLIEHGRSGLLVSADGFLDATAGLATDPARRAALGAAARDASLRWRWDEILDGVLAAYAAVLRV